MKTTLALILFFASNAQAKLSPTCDQANKIRLELNLISSNIANAITTRTPEGGPYKPFVRISCDELTCAYDQISKVFLKYEPQHPDADEQQLQSAKLRAQQIVARLPLTI